MVAFLIPRLPEPLVFTVDPARIDDIRPTECAWCWKVDPTITDWKELYTREAQIFRIEPEIFMRDEINTLLASSDTSNPWTPASAIDALGFLKDHGSDRRFNYPIVATAQAFPISIPGLGAIEGYLSLGRGGAKEYRGLRPFFWCDGYHGPLCSVLGVRQKS